MKPDSRPRIVRAFTTPLPLAKGLLHLGIGWELVLAIATVRGLTPVASPLAWLGWATAGGLLVALGLRGILGHRLLDSLTLSVTPGSLSLGGTASLEAGLTPARALRIERLVIHLRCHEKAVRRGQGEALSFLARVFEKSALVCEGLPAQRGQEIKFSAAMKLPVDRSANFWTSSYAVEWSATVELELLGFPPISRSWRLDVRPILAG